MSENGPSGGIKPALIGALIGGIFLVIAACVTGVFAVITTLLEQRAGLSPTLTDTPIPPTPTATPTFTPIITTPEFMLTTTGVPDTPTPTPTSTPTSTPTPTATVDNGLQIYDAFDNNCTSGNLWEMFVDSQPSTTFLPTPVSQCWELAPQGFSQHSGRLNFDHTNTAVDDIRSFLLATQPKRAFTAVELDLTVDSAVGDWAGIGLFTRLNDAERTWAYYWLRFGGTLPIDQGRMVYEDETQIEGEQTFPLPTTIKVKLRWDGNQMYFYTDDRQVFQPIPFSGFSDTFGIYWVTGPGSSLKGHVDNFWVSWKNS